MAVYEMFIPYVNLNWFSGSYGIELFLLTLSKSASLSYKEFEPAVLLSDTTDVSIHHRKEFRKTLASIQHDTAMSVHCTHTHTTPAITHNSRNVSLKLLFTVNLATPIHLNLIMVT